MKLYLFIFLDKSHCETDAYAISYAILNTGTSWEISIMLTVFPKYVTTSSLNIELTALHHSFEPSFDTTN